MRRLATINNGLLNMCDAREKRLQKHKLDLYKQAMRNFYNAGLDDITAKHYAIDRVIPRLREWEDSYD